MLYLPAWLAVAMPAHCSTGARGTCQSVLFFGHNLGLPLYDSSPPEQNDLEYLESVRSLISRGIIPPDVASDEPRNGMKLHEQSSRRLH